MSRDNPAGESVKNSKAAGKNAPQFTSKLPYSMGAEVNQIKALGERDLIGMS